MAKAIKKQAQAAGSEAAEEKPNVQPAAVGKSVNILAIKEDQVAKWKEIEKQQKDLVKKTPIIEVVTKDNYEAAKKQRTLLLGASTKYENEGKTIKSFLNTLKNNLWQKFTDVAKITRDHYEKQQAAITTYEAAVQAEKERKIKEAQEREERIKKSITDQEEKWRAEIDSMTVETMGKESERIYAEIVSLQDTFEEFEIFFDIATDNTKDRIDVKMAALKKAEMEADQKRKETHVAKIQSIQNQVLNSIMDATFDKIETVNDEILLVLDAENDFEEYQDSFESTKADLKQRWGNKVAELSAAAKKAEEDAKRDKELEELRKEKRYNERLPKLKAIDVVIDENGDGSWQDVIYTKQHILDDPDDVFDETILNIKRQQEAKLTQSGSNLAEASAEEKPQSEPAAENQITIDEVIAKETRTELGRVTTVAELIDILQDYPSNTKIKFGDSEGLAISYEDKAGEAGVIVFEA